MTLTDVELAGIRETVNDVALPDTCNILSPTNTSDDQGGYTTTWGTVSGGTAVACRVDAMVKGKAVEMVGGAAIQDYRQFIVTLPYNTALNAEDRIEHGSDTYAVKTLVTDTSWIASVRATMEKVD